MVVVVGRGGAIGAGGALPWHVPEDLAHFKAVTTGHVMIMGATTWRSIGRALPGRRTIVVSGSDLGLPDGVDQCADPHRALARAMQTDASPCIVGGAQIYAALLDDVVRIWLTDLDAEAPGADTFWPGIPTGFVEVAAWRGDDRRLTFRVYDRAR